MKKVKIWDEAAQYIDDENIIYIILKEYTIDDIQIISVEMCDKKGNKVTDGVLLHFDFNFNTLILNDKINPYFPIKTNFKGELIPITENEFRNFIKEKRTEEMHHQMMKSIEQEYTRQEEVH